MADNNHQNSVQVIDLLWLRPGVTLDQVREYQGKMAPIAAKHGGRPMLGFRVDATMKGDLQPNMIGGFEFPSAAELQALFADPDYQAIVPLRDSVFDMTKHVLFRVTSLMERK